VSNFVSISLREKVTCRWKYEISTSCFSAYHIHAACRSKAKTSWIGIGIHYISELTLCNSNQELLTLHAHFGSPLHLCGVCVAYLISFPCCISFVCFFFVLCTDHQKLQYKYELGSFSNKIISTKWIVFFLSCYCDNEKFNITVMNKYKPFLIRWNFKVFWKPT
jgi:hypothetical protein